MKKNLLNKICGITILIILIGLAFNPIVSSKETNEEENEKIILNLSYPNSNENKIFSLNEKEFNLLKSLISEIIQNLASGKKSTDNLIDSITKLDTSENTFLTGVINFIKDIILQKNDGLSLFPKKTLVISQGWSYNLNIFKNGEFKVKSSIFSFWHYAHGSRVGGESKTLVIRSGETLFSEGAELYKGRQVGLSYRPTGLYIYQKNMLPKPSYTLFIGLTNNVFAHAEVEVDLALPLK